MVIEVCNFVAIHVLHRPNVLYVPSTLAKPASFLKEVAYEISPALSLISQASLDQGYRRYQVSGKLSAKVASPYL